MFPTMPSGAKHCAACHGDTSTAYQEPLDRDHPTEQGTPVPEWGLVCGSCHDSGAAASHIDANTTPGSGIESCSICHGPGRQFEVDVLHMIR